MRFLKIHGQYRTGTNAICVALSRAFPQLKVLTNGLGFKHGPYNLKEWKRDSENLDIEDAFKEVTIIVVTKNPYAWIASMLKWRPIPPKNGIDDPIIPVQGTARKEGRDEWTREYMIKALQRFNSCYREWSKPHPERCKTIFIRFEDFIRNEKAEIERVSRIIDVKLKGRAHEIKRIVLPGEKISGQHFDKAYYLNGLYFTKLSKERVNLISEYTAWDIMRKFGYQSVDKSA